MVDGAFLDITKFIVLLLLLSAAVVTDLKSHRIPNALLAPALCLALALQTLGTGVDGIVAAFGGVAIGLAMLLPFYIAGGMGAGDVKLLGVVGAFLGPWGAVVAGLATMVAGAVLGIGVILWQRFWPMFEPYAEQMTNLTGNELQPAAGYKVRARGPTTTKIAYSPAIAVGTALALWYTGLAPFQTLV